MPVSTSSSMRTLTSPRQATILRQPQNLDHKRTLLTVLRLLWPFDILKVRELFVRDLGELVNIWRGNTRSSDVADASGMARNSYKIHYGRRFSLDKPLKLTYQNQRQEINRSCERHQHWRASWESHGTMSRGQPQRESAFCAILWASIH